MSPMKKSGYLYWLKRGRYKLSDKWETAFCELSGRSNEDNVGVLTVFREKTSVAIGLSTIVDVVGQPLQNNRYLFALPRTDGRDAWMFGADTDAGRQEWVTVVREMICSHLGIPVEAEKALARLTVTPTPYAKQRRIDGRHFAVIRDGYLRLYTSESLEQVHAVNLASAEAVDQDGSGLTTITFTELTGKSPKQHKLAVNGSDMTSIYTQLSRATNQHIRDSGSSADDADREQRKDQQHRVPYDIASPTASEPQYSYFDELSELGESPRDAVLPASPATQMLPNGITTPTTPTTPAAATTTPAMLGKRQRLSPSPSSRSCDSGVSGDSSLHGNEEDNTTFRWWHSNTHGGGHEHNAPNPLSKKTTATGCVEGEDKDTDDVAAPPNSEVERNALEWLTALPKLLRADHDSVSKAGSTGSMQQDARSTRSIDSIASGYVAKDEERVTPDESAVHAGDGGGSQPPVPPLSAARVLALQKDGHLAIPGTAAAVATGPATPGKDGHSTRDRLPASPLPTPPVTRDVLPSLTLTRTLERDLPVAAAPPPAPGCPDIPKWSTARLRSYEEHKRSKLVAFTPAQGTHSLERRHMPQAGVQPPLPPSSRRPKRSLQLTTSAPPPLPARPASMHLTRRSASVSALQPLGHRSAGADLRRRLASAPTSSATCLQEHEYDDLPEKSTSGTSRPSTESEQEQNAMDIFKDPADPYQFCEAKKSKAGKDKSRKTLTGMMRRLKKRSSSLDASPPPSPKDSIPSCHSLSLTGDCGETAAEQHPRALAAEQHPRALATEQHPRALAAEQHPRALATEQHPRALAAEQHPRALAAEAKPLPHKRSKSTFSLRIKRQNS